MLKKVVLSVMAAGMIVAGSLACGVSDCGGGNTKCCTNSGGSTYFLTRAVEIEQAQ